MFKLILELFGRIAFLSYIFMKKAEVCIYSVDPLMENIWNSASDLFVSETVKLTPWLWIENTQLLWNEFETTVILWTSWLFVIICWCLDVGSINVSRSDGSAELRLPSCRLQAGQLNDRHQNPDWAVNLTPSDLSPLTLVLKQARIMYSFKAKWSSVYFLLYQDGNW